METITQLRVRDLMTEGVFAVHVDDVLATIDELMEERNIRHAPVVGPGGDLVGLISQRDLLRHSLKDLPGLSLSTGKPLRQAVTAGEIMTRDVTTTFRDQDIRDAARIMLDKKYGCLPVVEGTRLVGIITEADFVRFLAAGD